MNVAISETAEADLDDIGERLLENLGWDAIAIAGRLRHACLTLADMPFRYPLVPLHEKSGVRRRVCGSYLIFYTASSDTVTVLRVLHGAQDYERLIFPSD